MAIPEGLRIDDSIEADARRFRWLLDGNGYHMEEEYLCGHPPCSEKEKDEARFNIDQTIIERTKEHSEKYALACEFFGKFAHEILEKIS